MNPSSRNPHPSLPMVPSNWNPDHLAIGFGCTVAEVNEWLKKPTVKGLGIKFNEWQVDFGKSAQPKQAIQYSIFRSHTWPPNVSVTFPSITAAEEVCLSLSTG